MLENLISLLHDADNLHMSDLKSCLYKAAMIFLQKTFIAVSVYMYLTHQKAPIKVIPFSVTSCILQVLFAMHLII